MGKRLVDPWPRLCRLVEADDGLPVRPDVGRWTEDKLYFWTKYIDITTRAMVGNPKWSEIVYVDLFAGPGVCVMRESRKRIPGSVLIAANAPKAFSRLLVCENDAALACACDKRLRRSPAANRFRVYHGDCNKQVAAIAAEIPDGALTIAFIDPAALDVRFETLRVLAARGRVDMLILFADAYDVFRNVDAYAAREDSALDSFLGPGVDWREHYGRLENRTSNNIRRLFAELLTAELKSKLGYSQFGAKEMRSDHGALYRLIYASKHERGLDFWNKVAKGDASGQTTFL